MLFLPCMATHGNFPFVRDGPGEAMSPAGYVQRLILAHSPRVCPDAMEDFYG